MLALGDRYRTGSELGQRPLDDGKHRVVARRVRNSDTSTGWSRLIVLQGLKSAWFGLRHFWIDLDTEIVPEHVEISLGCFGDTGGWRNKFADLITH